VSLPYALDRPAAGKGFCVKPAGGHSSVDIMTLCREVGALYSTTVVEPWLGF